MLHFGLFEARSSKLEALFDVYPKALMMKAMYQLSLHFLEAVCGSGMLCAAPLISLSLKTLQSSGVEGDVSAIVNCGIKPCAAMRYSGDVWRRRERWSNVRLLVH